MATRRKPGATVQHFPRSNGTCPYCRAGIMQLQTHPITRAATGFSCDNGACGYRTLINPITRESFEERRRVIVERAAKAHRRSMAALARAERLKRASTRIVARRPPLRKK